MLSLTATSAYAGAVSVPRTTSIRSSRLVPAGSSRCSKTRSRGNVPVASMKQHVPPLPAVPLPPP